MSAKAKTISALIVDDEPLARRTIRDLLAEQPDIEIIGECSDGFEAVAFMQRTLPDLLFLDVQMPGLDGFETLARIEPARIPAIVFVTAYDQYALKAFDVHALDYLLKPFNDRRFREAVQQARTQIELKEISKVSQSLLNLLGDRSVLPEPAQPQLSRKNSLTRFMIKTRGRVIFIEASQVDWISADDYFIKLHVDGKTHLLRISMNELEEKLDPKTFMRIHRSTIVNFDRVKELRQTASGEYVVVLKTGLELKISRGRRERLQQLLMNSPD
jgi:two-component system LytT family response regulator